jgi:hypothetical protein
LKPAGLWPIASLYATDPVAVNDAGNRRWVPGNTEEVAQGPGILYSTDDPQGLPPMFLFLESMRYGWWDIDGWSTGD